MIDKIANIVVNRFNAEITKTAQLQAIENELKAKEKAINGIMSAIEQGIVTKTTKDRLLVLESQKEELETKLSLEKARQIKPLELSAVKRFLNYYARKEYSNDQEKNEFFNCFINRVVLYDDKVVIFYNTDSENSTVIKAQDTKNLLQELENHKDNALLVDKVAKNIDSNVMTATCKHFLTE